ncbi:MAG: hypothetical protein NC212_02295 [Staphylococcus sp.]|nr:hypothetical protein [Staphylococcus sp.]
MSNKFTAGERRGLLGLAAILILLPLWQVVRYYVSDDSNSRADAVEMTSDSLSLSSRQLPADTVTKRKRASKKPKATAPEPTRRRPLDDRLN